MLFILNVPVITLSFLQKINLHGNYVISPVFRWFMQICQRQFLSIYAGEDMQWLVIFILHAACGQQGCYAEMIFHDPRGTPDRRSNLVDTSLLNYKHC